MNYVEKEKQRINSFNSLINIMYYRLSILYPS